MKSKTMKRMQLPDLDGLIDPVTALAREAGHRILELFRSDALDVHYKADCTPVTKADQAAHDHIVAGLEGLTPGIPVLSEESGAGPHAGGRSGRDWHWLVDPLDGTRRFIRGSEEFTVNIALVFGRQPILGVVDAPAMEPFTSVTWAGAPSCAKRAPARRFRFPSGSHPSDLCACLPAAHIPSRRWNCMWPQWRSRTGGESQVRSSSA